ncbi:MAG: sigma-70 family RNA polymerase sigma factor, partial [Myxococcales bacterium]|nr:sigma-70 family RNA polymerase sigma factor [Myxococcales bacterium]
PSKRTPWDHTRLKLQHKPTQELLLVPHVAIGPTDPSRRLAMAKDSSEEKTTKQNVGPGDYADLEPDELVRRAQAGHQRAFTELVRRYRGRIFAMALHLTGSRSDADDVTQDAFLKAFAKIDTFEGRSQFFTWLYRIALYRGLNMKRDRGKRRSVDVDDPRLGAAVLVDAGDNPRRSLELHQAYGQLLVAFDELSPLLRSTVTLAILQKLSYAEVAVVLETTEGTVAWRIHEARRRMRKTLDRLEKDPTPAHIKLQGRALGRRHEALGLDAAFALLGGYPLDTTTG